MAYISFQPSDYFSTKLYTGTGSSNVLTGIGFQSDLIWTATRNEAEIHPINDSVSGISSYLRSNDTDSLETGQTQTITAQSSDGYTVGTEDRFNQSSNTFVSWNWKAGTSTGLDFSAGDITPSAYSVNTTSGIGIYKYTGPGTVGGDTLAHNLGATPKLVIVKQLTDAYSWAIQHNSVANTKILNLDNANASATNDAFHNTYPTSTLITLGSSTYTNAAAGTKDYIMYAFTPVTGYSHFTQYLGNGNADGMFINTGFEPAFLLVKCSSTTSGGAGNWYIFDSKRAGYNIANYSSKANDTDAEATSAYLDLLSNGFKIRNAAADLNGSGNHYSVMAFAKNPIIGQGGTVGVAR